MPKHGKYPDELRERAIRLVLDHGHEYGSQCLVAQTMEPYGYAGSDPVNYGDPSGLDRCGGLPGTEWNSTRKRCEEKRVVYPNSLPPASPGHHDHDEQCDHGSGLFDVSSTGINPGNPHTFDPAPEDRSINRANDPQSDFVFEAVGQFLHSHAKTIAAVAGGCATGAYWGPIYGSFPPGPGTVVGAVGDCVVGGAWGWFGPPVPSLFPG